MKKTLRALLCVLALACLLGIGSRAPRAQAEYYVSQNYATPRLIVTGAEVVGGKVIAGEDFKLVIHIENASPVANLLNIRLKLTSADNRIITASGSDSIYIDRLTPSEQMDVTVPMSSMPDLEQKVYTVTCQYSYENTLRTPFTDSAALSVPIVQPPRISVTEGKLSRTEIYVESKTSLSMKVNNLGKGRVYNVRVDFSGKSIEPFSTYVGNLDMGASKAVDVSILGVRAGSEPITAVVTYEDAGGEAQQLEEQFALSVLDYEEEEYEESASALPSPVLLIAAGAALLVLILVLAAARRRKKERQYE